MLRRKQQKRYKISEDLVFATDNNCVPILFSIRNAHRHVRLSASARALLHCFSAADAVALDDAISSYLALRRRWKLALDRSSIRSVAVNLIQNRILIEESDTANIYSGEMIAAYTESRAVPPAVCNIILGAADLRSTTRVLDLATGPGSVALQLAAVSENVIGMDISPGFLISARKKASDLGINAHFELGDANKLLWESRRFDVITMAQGFHWLDPVWATRGICHLLTDDGEYYAIETNAILHPTHPLRKHLNFGADSLDDIQSFFRRQASRYVRWFDLMGGYRSCPQITGRWILKEDRIFNFTFAKAYFFTEYVTKCFGSDPDSWRTLNSLLDGYSDQHRMDAMYWHVIQFKNKSRTAQTQDVSFIPDAALGET